jgi:hypothetical protein
MAAGGVMRGQDLASSAASPYDLAKYVKTHSDIDWGPLWAKLGVNPAVIFLPLHDPCSATVIKVESPAQTIVALQAKTSGFEVFLDYVRSGGHAWRFKGAYSPFVKYFPATDRIAHFGTKVFLLVTGQGEAGTGLSTHYQEWIDLTSERFEPVFGFTPEGDKSSLGQGVERTESGRVVAVDLGQRQSITVEYRMRFTYVPDEGRPQSLGVRSDRVVYSRKGNTGKFEIDPARSTASAQDVGQFYENLDAETSCDDFVRFDFAGLKAVASGVNSNLRARLADYLHGCGNTEQARQLKSLLSHRPIR